MCKEAVALRSSAKREPIRCWELLSCEEDACDAHSAEDLRCWMTGDNRCFPNGLSLTERLTARCFICPVFTANRTRAMGNRFSDGAVLDTLDALFAEAVDLSEQVNDLGTQARGKACQVELLSEVGKALQSTMEIERLLRIILTAVTAGDGLGFNRAFLLLVDEKDNMVKGRMAVGPAEPGEADLIWKAMEREGESLGGILSGLSGQEDRSHGRIMEIAERLVVPLDGPNKVARSLVETRSFIVSEASDDPEAQDIVRVLGSNRFVVVPLVAEGKKLGAIIADNFVTGRTITEADRRILETFASQAALAMLNASLHSDLRSRLEEVHRAHEELRRNHLQLLRAQTQVALGGLASTLIHDLKAPLVSIGLMARAAATDLEEGHSLRSRLEQISEKALEVEQHLEAAGKSGRKGSSPCVEVDMEALIRDSLGLLKGLMVKSGVRSVERFDSGEALVKGDLIQLRQLLLNLIQNAVEAMPSGGTVTVETGKERDLLRINIRDTGPGIPRESKPKIFTAFFTTKSEGLGLGLFSAKRIAQEHGGRIEIQSEEGTGTCFTVLLPSGK
jgi:signal transduction histidine kinase